MTPLHTAAQSGSVEQVQALLDRFVEIDPVDVCSESPPHLAARQGYTDILCKHGPSVNATNVREVGLPYLSTDGPFLFSSVCAFDHHLSEGETLLNHP